jgi:hypothetical protein
MQLEDKEQELRSIKRLKKATKKKKIKKIIRLRIKAGKKCDSCENKKKKLL